MKTMYKETSKHLVKGALWQTASQFSLKIISFIYLVFLARAVSKEVVGEFYFVLSVLSLFAVFSDLGLNNTMIRYLPYFYGKKRLGDIRRLVKIIMIIGGTISALLVALTFLFAQDIAAFFNNPSLSSLFQLMSISVLLFFLFNALQTFLISRNRVRENATGNIIQNVTKLLLTFIFLYVFGPTTFSVALAFIVGYVLSITYSLYHSIRIWRVLEHEKSLEKSIGYKKLLREVLPFGVTITLITVFGSVAATSDRIMLGYFLPVEVASPKIAVYSVSLTLSVIVGILTASIGTPFLPKISELVGRGMRYLGQINRLTSFTMKWSVISMVPLLTFIIIFSRQLLGVIYGPEYEEGYIVLILLSIAAFLIQTTHAQRLVLAGMRLVKLEFGIVVISTIVNIGLNFILIPIYGAEGAAFAFATSYLVITLLTQYFSSKIYKFSIDFEIYKSMAAAVVPLAFFFLVQDYVSGISVNFDIQNEVLGKIINKLAELGILSIPFLFGSAIYLLALNILKVFDKHEVGMLSSALVKIGIPKNFIMMLKGLLRTSS